jgi:hypothetical protein
MKVDAPQLLAYVDGGCNPMNARRWMRNCVTPKN